MPGPPFGRSNRHHLLHGGHVVCRLNPSRPANGALTVGTLIICASCTSLTPHVLHTTPAHRGPTIVLAYPERGAPLPSDKPVIPFRFAPREADDPIDPASFRATVDGVDQTAVLRVSCLTTQLACVPPDRPAVYATRA
jgi:hypothetical protein